MKVTGRLHAAAKQLLRKCAAACRQLGAQWQLLERRQLLWLGRFRSRCGGVISVGDGNYR